MERGERRNRPNELSLEDATRMAKETALQAGGHVPMILAESGTSRAICELGDMPEAHEDRVRLMLAVGYTFAHSGAVDELQQVFFISEGWMSIAEEGEPPAMRPMQDPGRREVLLITSRVLAEQRNRAAVLEMIRDAEGNLTDLVDLELPNETAGGEVESPLLNAFAAGFFMAKRGMVD